jgi:hypothetical protein
MGRAMLKKGINGSVAIKRASSEMDGFYVAVSQRGIVLAVVFIA